MFKNFYSALAAIFFISSSCSQNRQETGYLILESEISAGELTQVLMPKKVLIINHDYNVLEFHEKFKMKEGQFAGADTLSVFFINTKKNTYSAYKTINKNEKPYKIDQIDNKKEGITFYSKKVDLFSNVSNILIRDTIVNNVKYKLATGSKDSENGKLLYEAYILKVPEFFPVQISNILSDMTDGGFVERIVIKDLNNKKDIIFKSQFEHGEIPVKFNDAMRAWGKN